MCVTERYAKSSLVIKQQLLEGIINKSSDIRQEVNYLFYHLAMFIAKNTAGKHINGIQN